MGDMAEKGMPLGSVAPEIILIVGAVVTLLYALFAPRRAQRGAAILAMVTVAVAAVASALMLKGGQEFTFFDTYSVDDTAVWAKLIILVAGAVTIGLSVEWFATDQRHGEYYTLLLLAILGAVVLAAAADLMAIIIGLLLSSATGYVLSAFHRTNARSGEAAIKYYLLGALTNGALVYGAVLLFGLGATTTLVGLADALPGADSTALVAGSALMILGLTFKLGAVPAHAWVPDVADGAPACRKDQAAQLRPAGLRRHAAGLARGALAGCPGAADHGRWHGMVGNGIDPERGRAIVVSGSNSRAYLVDLSVRHGRRLHRGQPGVGPDGRPIWRGGGVGCGRCVRYH